MRRQDKVTNKTDSGTDVDFNCPRSHEKEEVPFHRPLLFPSSFPPLPHRTTIHRGQLQGEQRHPPL